MPTTQRTSTTREHYKMLQKTIRRRRQKHRQIRHRHRHLLPLLFIIFIMNDSYVTTSSPPVFVTSSFLSPTPHRHRHPFSTKTTTTVVAAPSLSFTFKSSSSSTTTTVNNYQRTHLSSSPSSSLPSNPYILVDVENVRGKTGFTLSHLDLLSRIASWMSWQHLTGRISLVVDHGSIPSAYHLPDVGLSIIFSGSDGTKADDVIARDVTTLTTESLPRDDGEEGSLSSLVVVTADGELMDRCRRAATTRRRKTMETEHENGGRVVSLRIWDPEYFLSLLDRAVEERGIVATFDEKRQEEDGVERQEEEDDDVIDDDDDGSDSEVLLKRMEMEIDVTNRLLELEKQLTFTNNNNKRNRSSANKKRKKLLKRADNLRHRLASLGPSTLRRVVSVATDDDDDETNGLDRREQNELLKRWDVRLERHRRTGRSSSTRERTGDRILLAENFRRYLERRQDEIIEKGEDDDDEEEKRQQPQSEGTTTSSRSSLAERHARYVNSLLPTTTTTNAPPRPSSSSTTLLRLVIISDTHGYESSLSSLPHHHLSTLPSSSLPSPTEFPTGDVLIHCGDFSSDGNKQSSLRRFDSWISSLNFRHVFVLRGNHDPLRYSFDGDAVTYVTEDRVAIVNGVRLKFHPFRRHRTRRRRDDEDEADVWISHEPPRGVLDWCYNGDRAGNGVLTDRLIRLAKGRGGGGIPKVWLCGHIHESRGVEIVDFSRLDGGGGSHRRRRSIIDNDGNDDNTDTTTKTTVVINACNANGGKAERLIHGPMVLDLESRRKFTNDDEITPRLLSSTSNNNDGSDYSHETIIPSSSSSDGDDTTTPPVNRLLLAVDVGLNMGAALYDDGGRLLRYEQFKWNNEEELRLTVPRIVASWEKERNDDDFVVVEEDGDGSGGAEPRRRQQDEKITKKWSITHIAVEGGGSLSHVWERYCASSSSSSSSGIQLLKISPFEWRRSLLTKKERLSGRSSKEASRLVARQIVYRRGYHHDDDHDDDDDDDDDGTTTATRRRKHQGSFPTDVAESVVMGLYVVSERLGWITTSRGEGGGGGGLVKRYTNGDVILPK